MRDLGCQKMMNSTKGRSVASFKRKVNNFNCKLLLLFDIAFCKCIDILKCVWAKKKCACSGDCIFKRSTKKSATLYWTIRYKSQEKAQKGTCSKSSSDKIHEPTLIYWSGIIDWSKFWRERTKSRRRIQLFN